MTMKYCEDLYCETPDEPIERVSDYRILDGAVICTHCHELEQDATEWIRELEQDAQLENDANQLDLDDSVNSRSRLWL